MSKIAIEILLGIIFGPLIIIGIIKIISKLSGAVKIKPSASWGVPFVFLWKYFLKPKKLITWGLLVAVVYGFYLLYAYCRPTPEQLTFRGLAKNLAELELKPDKDKLASLDEKVKEGKTLTVEEKRAAMMAEEKIRMVRKEYSKGNLVAPPKPSPSPPETASMPKPPKGEVKEEVWDWVFEWEASEQQMASGQMVRGRVNEAQLLSLSCDALVLKFRYKRQQNGEIINLTLTRKNRNEPYFGRVAQKNLYLRVWLMPNPKEPGNFKGQFDNGPGTISLDVFLRKI